MHEYGGGEFLLVGDTIYFVNDKDQDVYALVPGQPPQRITEAPRPPASPTSPTMRRAIA